MDSNPIGSTKNPWSDPDTWVTERTGYIGNVFGSCAPLILSWIFLDFVSRSGRFDDDVPDILIAKHGVECAHILRNHLFHFPH